MPLHVSSTMCSKHVEAYNKLIINIICALSWLITKILLLVSHLAKQLHNLPESSHLLTSLSCASGERHIMCDDLPVLH